MKRVVKTNIYRLGEKGIADGYSRQFRQKKEVTCRNEQIRRGDSSDIMFIDRSWIFRAK
jgi:hypothetical protein